jgi:hypothetical protein
MAQEITRSLDLSCIWVVTRDMTHGRIETDSVLH